MYNYIKIYHDFLPDSNQLFKNYQLSLKRFLTIFSQDYLIFTLQNETTFYTNETLNDPCCSGGN